jgi:hypothetical protein
MSNLTIHRSNLGSPLSNLTIHRSNLGVPAVQFDDTSVQFWVRRSTSQTYVDRRVAHAAQCAQLVRPEPRIPLPFEGSPSQVFRPWQANSSRSITAHDAVLDAESAAFARFFVDRVVLVNPGMSRSRTTVSRAVSKRGRTQPTAGLAAPNSCCSSWRVQRTDTTYMLRLWTGTRRFLSCPWSCTS